jgi:hypothetical protein
MAVALITAFFDAKMQDPRASVALYTISSDLDTASIVKQTSARVNAAVLAMLATCPHPFHADVGTAKKDLQVVCDMVQGAMAGVSRRLLEGPSPAQRREILERELIQMLCAYLDSCSAAPHLSTAPNESRNREQFAHS